MGMQANTTMGAALVRAGYNKAEMTFWAALERACLAFIADDGDEARGRYMLYRAATKLLGDGQNLFGSKSQPGGVQAQHPHDAANGQELSARAAISWLPTAASTQADGRSQVSRASNAQPAFAPSVRPLPRPSQRTPAVMALAARAATLAIWDTMTVKGGTPWRLVAYGALGSIAYEGARDAALAKMIKNHVANADPATPVEDIISLTTFQKFVQKAAEMSDGA